MSFDDHLCLEIRRALHGDAAIVISLELLHATDMGAKKEGLHGEPGPHYQTEE